MSIPGPWFDGPSAGGDTFLYSESGSHSSTLLESQNDTSGTFQTDNTSFDETTNQSTSLTKTGSDLFAFAETGAATITTGGTETFALTKSRLQSSTLDENNGDSGGSFAENARTFDEDNSATFVLNETRSDGTSTAESTYDTGGVRFSGNLGNYSLTEPASTSHTTTTDPRAALPDALPLARVNIPAPIQGVPLGRASAPVTDMPMSLGTQAPDLSAPRTLPAMQGETRGLTDTLYRGEDVQMSDLLYRGEDAKIELLSAGANDGGENAGKAAPETNSAGPTSETRGPSDLLYRGEEAQMSDAVYRGEEVQVQLLAAGPKAAGKTDGTVDGRRNAAGVDKEIDELYNEIDKLSDERGAIFRDINHLYREAMRRGKDADKSDIWASLDLLEGRLKENDIEIGRLKGIVEAKKTVVNALRQLEQAKAGKPSLESRLAEFGRLIIKNAQNPSGVENLPDLGEFGLGAVEGFAVNGFWGTVTGAWELVKLAYKLNGVEQGAFLLRWSTGNLTAADKEMLAKGEQALKIMRRQKKFMDETGAPLLLAAGTGNVAEVARITAAMPEADRQLIMTAVEVALEMGIHTLEMSPRERGKIFGQILYEVAEFFALAGVGKALTATAKSAKVAAAVAKLEKLVPGGKGKNVAKLLTRLLELAEGGKAIKAEKGVEEAEEALRKARKGLAKALEEAETAQSCFPADTLVRTRDGFKTIQSVLPEDVVWGYHTVRREWMLQRVVETYEHDYEGDLVALTVEGEIIEATSNHPFWVLDGEALDQRGQPEHVPTGSGPTREGGLWVEAGQLRVGDRLLLRSGQEVRIGGLAVRAVRQPVYNIEVESAMLE